MIMRRFMAQHREKIHSVRLVQKPCCRMRGSHRRTCAAEKGNPIPAQNSTALDVCHRKCFNKASRFLFFRWLIVREGWAIRLCSGSRNKSKYRTGPLPRDDTDSKRASGVAALGEGGCLAKTSIIVAPLHRNISTKPAARFCDRQF